MKVLITRSSENQTIGGAELSAHDQALVLKNLGYTPYFFSNNKMLRHNLQDKGIDTYPSLYLQRFRPPLRYAYFFLLLPIKVIYDLLLALILRPDIINPHTREDQISFTFSKVIHRRPVVWKDPGDIFFILNQSHGAFGKLYKKLYLGAAKRADAIYLLNHDDRSVLLSTLGKKYTSRLFSVPSSILYDRYSPSNKTSKDNTLVFGSTCRLTDIKNVSATISAYLKAKDDLPKSRLLIVGDGPERKRLESLAKKDPDVIFVGAVDNISPHLNDIDIFIHAAYQEGWGRNIKEAMYFGKAIIGSNVGGIAQQITDRENGLLFDPNNIDQLATLMMELAQKKELREKIARNARKKASRDGDFTDIVKDRIIPIYRSVASTK